LGKTDGHAAVLWQAACNIGDALAFFAAFAITP
jgi:hypothetical protein